MTLVSVHLDPCGQSEHFREATYEYVPPVHCVLTPLWQAYPASHVVHEAVPSLSEYVPPTHSVHLVAPELEKVPLGQIVRVVAVHEYPGGHIVQREDPALLE